MEQMTLENEQIEVTVNIHGAELRSLKSKEQIRNICGMQMQNTGTYITGVISICRRSKE